MAGGVARIGRGRQLAYHTRVLRRSEIAAAAIVAALFTSIAWAQTAPSAGAIVATVNSGRLVFTNVEDGAPPASARPAATAPARRKKRAHLRREDEAAAANLPHTPAGRVRIGTLLNRAAERYRLSPKLVRAVARQESDWRPHATSDKGAMGVMQLMPGTARILGVRHPYNPAENIDGGARFLHDLMRQYHGNLRLSLAAYNAGPDAVARYGGHVPPFPETRAYVRAILRHLRNGAGQTSRAFRSPIPARALIAAGIDAAGNPVFSNVP